MILKVSSGKFGAILNVNVARCERSSVMGSRCGLEAADVVGCCCALALDASRNVSRVMKADAILADVAMVPPA
jgi:hypothetical protein